MCGPVVAWDWFVVDFAFVLVLVSGALVFRARGSPLATWAAFGVLSALVGGFLFYFTWDAQTASASALSSGAGPAALFAAC